MNVIGSFLDVRSESTHATKSLYVLPWDIKSKACCLIVYVPGKVLNSRSERIISIIEDIISFSVPLNE